MRRGSATKPMRRRGLDRTVVKMQISFSRPCIKCRINEINILAQRERSGAAADSTWRSPSLGPASRSRTHRCNQLCAMRRPDQLGFLSLCADPQRLGLGGRVIGI